jgi:hypothetical protein
MRRAPAWVVAVGVVVAWAATSSPAQAVGVWVTLAAGLPGGSSPSDSSEFWFDSPHAPPQVAVNSLTGGTTAQATTGGGNAFFGGAGTPVLLNLADGSAYIASGNPPSSATTRGPGGGSAGTPASAAPVAGGTVPSDAALLGINLADPGANGSRSLAAAITNANGAPLGTGTIVVPAGGWWVIGLTPGANTTPPPNDPPPSDPPPVTPPPTDPPPVTPPVDPPPSTGGGDPAATPEPATIILVGIGGIAAHAWRRLRGGAPAQAV